MMTKQEAQAWARDLCETGAHQAMRAYREQHGIGEVAELVWDKPDFEYGVEYGLLIAVDRIFAEKDEPHATKENTK